MNRYASLVGSNKIKDEWSKINAGFDAVQADMDLSTALRQAVINGGFAINQRVKTGTVTLAAGAYGHDRWKAGAAGCTYTFATVNNVTTFTIQAGSLMQVIEGANIYSGNYTLSWQGSAQGRINSGAYGSSGVTALLTGGNNTTIEFSTGTLSNVQFNYGSSIFPFQTRLLDEEMRLCYRYYERFDASTSVGGRANLGIGVANSSTTVLVPIHFKAEKRITPTLTQGGSGWRLLPGGLSLTSLVIEDGIKIGVNLRATYSSGGLTLNQSYVLQSVDGSTSWIAFDAEI